MCGLTSLFTFVQKRVCPYVGLGHGARRPEISVRLGSVSSPLRPVPRSGGGQVALAPSSKFEILSLTALVRFSLVLVGSDGSHDHCILHHHRMEQDHIRFVSYLRFSVLSS